MEREGETKEKHLWEPSRRTETYSTEAPEKVPWKSHREEWSPLPIPLPSLLQLTLSSCFSLPQTPSLSSSLGLPLCVLLLTPPSMCPPPHPHLLSYPLDHVFSSRGHAAVLTLPPLPHLFLHLLHWEGRAEGLTHTFWLPSIAESALKKSPSLCGHDHWTTALLVESPSPISNNNVLGFSVI